MVCVDQNGFLDHTLDREKYRASEMPQAFKYDLIKEAYEKVNDFLNINEIFELSIYLTFIVH